MDLETKFKKETGYDAYTDNDLRPKVPSDYYVEWLEEQLTLTDVVSSSTIKKGKIDDLGTSNRRLDRDIDDKFM
tara:strand:+ start:455 stop:676 length:222 start_codon:yes stop_codon:yes gene_type:complete